MEYLLVFELFWKEVVKSIENRTFAKLTLAKTIGDTEIKNIFVRPVLLKNDAISYSMIIRYKTEEVGSFDNLDNIYTIISSYINNPFLTVLLFTSEKDVTFKLNKKRAGSIVEQAPTFKNPSDVILEIKAKGL